MSEGFVNRAYRDMVNWQWYYDLPVRILFFHLLAIVNEDDKMECGICIKSGSVLTTIAKLGKETLLTSKQIRIALAKLSSSEEISVIPSRQNGTIINITKWSEYKCNNASNIVKGKQRANEGQTEHSDFQDITSDSENQRANEGQTETSSSNPQKEDISPTPPIEVKNNIQEKDKKEEDKSSSIKEKETKPKYRIQFNFETNRFDGITEQDIELWHNAYPAIDIQNEITKAACWLVANPNRKKSNYKQFLNNWLCKAQDHAPRLNQQMLPFSQPMSYGDRKRQQAGQDVSKIPGFVGKEFDFDKDAPDNPF